MKGHEDATKRFMNIRRLQCHEETEKAQRVKALEQVEAWGRAAAVEVTALAVALVETASALSAVKRFPTRQGALVMTKNAPSAGEQ